MSTILSQTTIASVIVRLTRSLITSQLERVGTISFNSKSILLHQIDRCTPGEDGIHPHDCRVCESHSGCRTVCESHHGHKGIISLFSDPALWPVKCRGSAVHRRRREAGVGSWLNSDSDTGSHMSSPVPAASSFA